MKKKKAHSDSAFVRSALDGLALNTDKWTSLYLAMSPGGFLSQSKIETSYSLHLGPTGLGVEGRNSCQPMQIIFLGSDTTEVIIRLNG